MKIKGYQEQISALNSKCKMLTLKAKHATMLLTVSEVDGLSDGLEELEDEEEEMPKHPPAHPSVVMVSDLHLHMLGLGGVRWVLFFISLQTSIPWVSYFSHRVVCASTLYVSLLLFIAKRGNRMRVLVSLDFVNISLSLVGPYGFPTLHQGRIPH